MNVLNGGEVANLREDKLDMDWQISEYDDELRQARELMRDVLNDFNALCDDYGIGSRPESFAQAEALLAGN